MALTQPDTTVAVAHIAVRYLREVGPLDKATLLRRLGPLDGQEAAVRMTVSALVDAGVLVEQAAVLSLSPTAESATKEPDAIRECLFASTHPNQLWNEEKPGSLGMGGGIDLVRALAWYLTLDAFAGAYSYDRGDGRTDHRQAQELGVQVVANKERWLPFGRWAGYLGFARLVDGRLFVDPTQAVARVLAVGSEGQSSWTHQEILALVASSLPVLDGGVFHESIRARQAAHGVELSADADVSTALTLALMVLADLGKIKLEEGAGDASKARLAHELGVFHRVNWVGDDGD